MAHGAPVLVSAHGALPEVAGDVGVVLPDDPEAWAAAVRTTSTLDPVRAASARARAALFTPEAAAQAQRAVYDELR